MDKRKLLIADNCDEFPRALTNILQSEYQIRSCMDGKEALELLQTFRPDILFLELMLPNLDGISLLEAIAVSGLHPKVLVVSRIYTDYALESLTRFRVNYIIQKPCDVRATAERIREVDLLQEEGTDNTPDRIAEAAEHLLALGLSTKHRGFSYLQHAIVLMARDPRQSITKELYPAVAELCNGGKANVERAIRTAITAAWERRNEAVWQAYFAQDPDGTVHRPTNAEFISRLVRIFPE